MKKLNPKAIAYYALLIALNVILTRVGSIRIGGGGLELVRIGFGGFPVIFAGIIFGPLAGGIIGALGDIIGMMLNPMGGFMPHFTLNAALLGVIPGIVMIRCKDKDCLNSTWKLILAISAAQIISSIIVWAYFMTILFGASLKAILPVRIVSHLANIPIYFYMTRVLLNRLPIPVKGN